MEADRNKGMSARSLEVKEASSLLRNGQFRRLWAAQFSAVMMYYSLTLAGAVVAEELTQSSAQIGLVILSSILPAFLASLVCGAVVDRWGRVQVLIFAKVVRIVTALAFWMGTQALPIGLALATVYTANVVGATFTQFAISAELSLLPDLVDEERLLSANALIQLSTLVAQGLGIVALGPLVIKLVGAPTLGLVGAALCVFALVLIMGLPRDRTSPARSTAVESILADLGADLQTGWRTITRDRVLRLVAVQLTLASALLMVLLSVVPGLTSRYLGLGVEDAPFLILPGGLGFVLGSILLGRWEGRFSRPGWIALGLTCLGLSLGLLGVLGGRAGQADLQDAIPFAMWLILPLLLGLGLAMAMVIVPARTVLQERPPASMRGRVIAAQLALANAVAVLPLLLGGSLADHLGIQPVMTVLSLLAFGGGAVGLHHLLR
jgi:MFS family permease